MGRGAWPVTDFEMYDEPEILYLMLVEGDGEVKRRVQMVGPIDVSRWREAKPEWRCISLA